MTERSAPPATFEDLVAEKLGDDRRIQWVTKLPDVSAYKVEFKDEDTDPILVSWLEVREAGIPESDLDIYMVAEAEPPPAPPARTPEEWALAVWRELRDRQPGTDAIPIISSYGAALLEEAAMVVDGWHIKRGGYTELAHEIRALAEKHSLAVPTMADTLESLRAERDRLQRAFDGMRDERDGERRIATGWEGKFEEAEARIRRLEETLRAYRGLHRRCVILGTGLDVRCARCREADAALASTSGEAADKDCPHGWSAQTGGHPNDCAVCAANEDPTE